MSGGFSWLISPQHFVPFFRECFELFITDRQGTLCLLASGFVPFFEQKIQGLFKDFQGYISHFFKDSIQCKKEPWVYIFLVLPQHEQFCNEGFSAFAGLDKVSTEIPAPTIIFKDFQGACEPCSLTLIQLVSLSRLSWARNFGLTEKRLHWLCFHQSYAS